jgi:hypothetical protein
MNVPKTKISILTLTSLCFILSSCISNKPKILIIGDSISMGYTPLVRKQLKKQARIYHNPKNAQHTGVGLKNSNNWIKKEKWDIIQFNWGLWDMCYRIPEINHPKNKDKTTGIITNNKYEYATNLDSIVETIKRQTNAKLVFVTTTHVPEQDAGRYANDVTAYNDTAKIIMKKHGVCINDIHKQSIIIHNNFGKGSNDVHYYKEGYKKLSDLISIFLEKQLKKNSNEDSLRLE